MSKINQPAMSRIGSSQAESLKRYNEMFPQKSVTPTVQKVSSPIPVAPTVQKAVTSSKQSSAKKTSTPKVATPKISKAEEDYQKQLQKNLEEQFTAGESFISGQEQRLQAFQPQVEEQIRATYEAQVPQIQEQLRQQTAGITAQQEETKAQRESALAQARRQFQEGTQRSQAMFGGVRGSSAGLAQSELLARELARQTGATTRQAQQNIMGLEENLRNVQATSQQALRQIELDKQNAVTKARDAFREQLNTINSQRFQLAQDKANKQLQALQDFNNRRRQLEDFYTQQQAAIENYKAQQQLGLENYAQQLAVAQRFQPAQQTTQQSSLANLAGINLDALSRTNPAQARQIALEIAGNPSLQQQYRARVSGNTLQYLTPEGNFGTISLQ